VGAQRCARIDPNPHQIDAVMFALGRVREGGCILADEVGLGKTIEAGLVIAQLQAEGVRRVLLVAPKPLVGQWRNELHDLFAINAVEGHAGEGGFEGDGVFLVGREFVGTDAGSKALAQARPFELCVVDEAHEVFAAIYKRFDSSGAYDPSSKHAKTAGRLRDLLLRDQVPVLLLTATPIQNSLAELWGLVQFVDPTGTLLGDLATFRKMFCDGDDRELVAGLELELKQRMSVVVKRTLRRQAQEFMKRPFVARRTRLFEYEMSPAEQRLYNDVTEYLLQPRLCAFRGRQRRLLLIGFHRRMASSHRALAVSLDKVAARLRLMLDGGDDEGWGALDEFQADLEDHDEADTHDLVTEDAPPTTDAIAAELALIEGFAAQARELDLQHDSKAHALIQAARVALDRERKGEATGKLVIFTESLTTQEYIRDLLLDSRLVDIGGITLFRGTNDGPRAQQALDRWIDEVGCRGRSQPSRDVCVRLALVHEFRTRSRIFISTEAGAKGLNLQFCDTLVNYDLPWNPQRIEQRIGRCHRYGQERDVTVINFLARGNEAQRLTFEILSQKLELFGTVLDASDTVLHAAGATASESLAGALSADFETTLRRIYERARSVGEIEDEIRGLRQSMGDRKADFEAVYKRTAGLIETAFDEDVQRVFRGLETIVPCALDQFDADIEQIVVGYLRARGIAFEHTRIDGATQLDVPASTALPAALGEGLTLIIGEPPDRKHSEPVHLGHPLVQAAITDARLAVAEVTAVIIVVPEHATARVQALVGKKGRLAMLRVRYGGFEPVELIMPILVADGVLVDLDLAREVFELASFETCPAIGIGVADEDLDDAIDEAMFTLEQEVGVAEEHAFKIAMQRLERYIDDRVLVLERSRSASAERLAATRERYDTAVGAAKRTSIEKTLQRLEGEAQMAEAQMAKLRARDDETYQAWRTRAYGRRYEAPEWTVILDVEFVIDERGG